MSRDCLACGGTGTVWRFVGDGSKAEIDCWACDGSGDRQEDKDD